jgi:hypothetical protein
LSSVRSRISTTQKRSAEEKESLLADDAAESKPEKLSTRESMKESIQEMRFEKGLNGV